MAQERVAQPDPVEIAGRYEVVQKLGAGAFGTVYKAKDRLLGRMVAIKTIRLDGLAASGASLDELLARFKREAQVSAQLKHANIVTIYDIGEFEGLSYLAMEFIDGPGLDKVISAAGRLSLERSAAIGAQIADALDYAHAHNVVHRDIKPANVMIEPGDRVKVTDFGIAKAIDSGEHLTVTGSLLGTPSYMSPEQARGAAIDGRSDLFSLGCILYEMLTGKKAFRGESITALIFKIITEEPQPITELEPSVPDAFTKVIARALSKAPETRYQTGRELAEALLALTSPGAIPTVRQVEVPTVATPATILQPTVARRAEATRVSGGATLPARPATAVGLPRQAVPAPAPAPGRRTSLAVVAVLGVLAVGFILALGAGAWFYLSRRPAPESADLTGATTTATPYETSSATSLASTSPVVPSPEDAGGAAATPAPRAATASLNTPAPALRDSGAAATSGVTAALTPESQAAPSDDYSFLDQPIEEGPDGREMGRQLANQYRQGGSSESGFGTSRRLSQRRHTPRPEHPGERPGIGVTRGLMVAEAQYRRRTGRYGTLAELNAVLPLLRVPPGQDTFQYRGYRFRVTATAESYNIAASPLRGGLRAFSADSESDYVAVAGED